MEPPAHDPDPVPFRERFEAGEVPGVPPALSGVEPNPSAAKTIGVLNIVFGACLLLCGLCCGLYMTAVAAMGPMMAVQQQQVQQQMQQAAEAQRQAELKE